MINERIKKTNVPISISIYVYVQKESMKISLERWLPLMLMQQEEMKELMELRKRSQIQRRNLRQNFHLCTKSTNLNCFISFSLIRFSDLVKVVGQSLQQLEVGEEQRRIREEQLQAQIMDLRNKLKASEYRGEQAEMNIQRLNVRIDQVILAHV